MHKIYTQKQIEKTIAELAERMAHLEAVYGIPRAYLQAVLFKEMSDADLLDCLADFAVKCYWLQFDVLSFFRRVLKMPPLRHFPGGLLNKRDSSTGYAQIFGYVAIRAIRYSLAHGLDVDLASFGLTAGHPLDENIPSDLCMVWRRLNRDVSFNLRLAALNLIAAAEEMTGRMDFSSYSPEEIQLIFTRYNANTRSITPYGREVYQYYLSFRQPSPSAPQTKAS